MSLRMVSMVVFLTLIGAHAAVLQPPVAGAEEPVNIGSDRQLFVDEFWLGNARGVSLRLHPPSPREVVLEMDRPWEGETSCYAVVVQDDGKYRMWYRADAADVGYTAYAESKDGIHWIKPQLGLVEFQGSTTNNLVWPTAGNVGINVAPFRDDNPATPDSERWKAIAKSPTERAIIGLVSPDGIRWRPLRSEPLLSVLPQDDGFDSHNIALWDPWTQRYVIYARGWIDGVRRIRRSTSSNFLHWEPLEFIGTGDAPVEHLYTNGATIYERAPSTYLMFPMRFVPDRQFFPGWPLPGLSDTVFMSSRDGLHWDRTFMEAVLRPGLDPDNWHERGVIMGRGILQTGPGELSLYYFEHYRTKTDRVRRATLRLDGFVSVNAPAAGGEFTTRPLVFRGARLEINYSTSAVGSVRVEIQDAEGNAIPGYALADCPEIFGDELERSVTWKRASDCSSLAGRAVRLRFALKDADLYAFRFAEAGPSAPAARP